MQIQDRFDKIKLNWAKIFRWVGVFVTISASGYAPETVAAETKTVPCQVRLEFSRDDTGKQLIRYSLFLQVKNLNPQPITSVSILWLDKNDEILGNSDADCKAENEPLEVGQTGQCSRTVQTISNLLIQSFGQSVWTDVVNSELKTFERIKSCKVLGYRYQTS